VLDQGERKKIKTVGRLHPREGQLVVETRAPEGSLAGQHGTPSQLFRASL